MERVLEGHTWCFDNMVILLKENDRVEQLDQVTITKSPFWVHIKNLSFNYRTDDIVRALIGNTGEIIEMEDDVLGIGRYRGVKVLLDVTKPLQIPKTKRQKGENCRLISPMKGCRTFVSLVGSWSTLCVIAIWFWRRRNKRNWGGVLT